MDLCCRKNLPQGDVPKDDHPDQALATHELIESHSGPAAKTTSAGLNWPLTAGLLEEVAVVGCTVWKPSPGLTTGAHLF